MARFNSNQLISKAVKFADEIAGHTARIDKTRATVLKNNQSFGKGIPKATVVRAERTAKVSAGRSFQSRVKGVVGAGAVTSAGFLGLHKYHQHQDNKILERIDKMYKGG